MSRIRFKKRISRPKVKGEKKGISFTSQMIPKEGIAAIILGFLSLLLFVVLSIFSAYQKGKGSLLIGGFGMGSFLLTLSGFVMSLRAMKKDNVYIKVPIYGVIINTFSLILYLILYFYGMILMMV